jgi:PhoH-like ATPase
MANYQKTFIIDTNVILHDPLALTTLSENNNNLIIIPITVLEELDKFKSGTNLINYNAREFIRKLEKGDIALKVDIVNYKFPETIPLEANSSDNKILACAYSYKGPNSYFVTKDINLRMKARAINLTAQDYKFDKIEYAQYNGYSKINVESQIIDELCNKGIIDYSLINVDEELVPNQYLLLKDSLNEKHSALGVFCAGSNTIKRLPEVTASGINPKNLEQTFALDALLNPYIPLVALTGISGSGKTLLSLAAAIQNKKLYHQIFITRQTVPVGNDLGFLPGTVEEKIRPYLEPFYDNLKFLRTINGNAEKIAFLEKEDKIHIAPITYSRGRSIPKVFLIVDEAQNLTPHEAKTIITRAGEGTKVILMGDIDQIDTPYLDKTSNGLAHTIHRFKGQSIFAYVHLNKGERSELAELASRIM